MKVTNVPMHHQLSHVVVVYNKQGITEIELRTATPKEINMFVGVCKCVCVCLTYFYFYLSIVRVLFVK